MSQAALQRAASMLGMNETDQRQALQEYLSNGGSRLDPAVTAWCAAFVNSSLSQAGLEGTGSNMARSFMDWGQAVDTPQPGDIAVFSRGDPNGPYGHVGFFQGYDENGGIRVLGGNQGGANMGGGGVSEAVYGADRLLGFRRAPGSQTPGNALTTLTPTPQPSTNALAALPQPQQPQQNALQQFQTAALDPRMFMRATPQRQMIPIPGAY